MGFSLKRKENSYNYFDEFENNAGYSLECAKMLQEVLKNYKNKDLQENLVKMHQIENKADEGKHSIVNYLSKDFLPPIEREDILELSQEIDTVTDLIEEVLINIDLFNIAELRTETQEFIDLLVTCCEKEHDLFVKFKKIKDADVIKKEIIELNRLEEQGDKLYIKSMRKLYRDGTDTLDVIKWATIFNCFENCYDTCEHVADSIESIVLRNL